MLEMRAIVIQVMGEEASVQPLSSGGCGHCDSEGGCGSGTLSKLFCSSKPRSFKVRNEAGAKVGDEVQVSIPDGVLLRGAVKMYVLPLILLLVGGVAGVGLAGEASMRDAYAATGASIGLLLGFILARLSPGVGQAVASSIVVTSRSGS
jgi:sigma-E factor negative regulatory protein RseC